MMSHNLPKRTKGTLLAGFLASSILVSSALTPAAQGEDRPGQTTTASSSPGVSPTPKTVASPAAARSSRAANYYKSIWGVEIVGIRDVSSGSMLRFSYRVTDVKKAAALNDKKWNPYLVDEKTGAKLAVPTMDKVGQLRQTGPQDEGHIYWMVFANPGGLVKPGNRVDVVIGSFRVNGLIVE
jgi:hypothetical protein